MQSGWTSSVEDWGLELALNDRGCQCVGVVLPVPSDDEGCLQMVEVRPWRCRLMEVQPLPSLRQEKAG